MSPPAEGGPPPSPPPAYPAEPSYPGAPPDGPPPGALPSYPATPPVGPDEAAWHRVHPLSAVARSGRSLVGIVVALVVAVASSGGPNLWSLVSGVIVVIVVLAAGVVSWMVTRWRLEGNVLRIDSGLIRRESQRLPLSQLQAIDIVAPGMARVLGLAELRLRMGGSAGKGGRLSYLPVASAEALRARLLAMAHGQAEDTPAPPERQLLAVHTGRLLVSVAIGRQGLIVLAAVAAVLVVAVVAPGALPGVISAGGALLIGLATAVWRQLNSGYRLTLAEAADGLRVRSGLVETAAETIPYGRIQAVRLVQPASWRLLGWCQVVVDVAGKERKSRENSAQAKSLRSLLPVGTLAEANWLIGRLVPGAPTERLTAPARVRWKSPLRYGQLAWGANETCVVTTSGRLRHVTDWVPLTKVQSIRRVEGPVQRRLSLASVHLDTAGRGIDATVRDRERSECDAIMADLPDRCRAARRASTTPSRPRPEGQRT